MKIVRWFALAVGVNLMATVPASVLGPATAFATPATGVDAVTISQSTVDGRDYITREITILPGGSTGWHYHDGEVFGVIREGTLTHDAADCTVDGIYPDGAPITEASGPDHVHIGRNLESVPLVMWVTYIDAAGAPLSVDVPDPGCGFS
jgi:mannose-6-phosphate isomerase-like protein (cupin superfamily)